MRTIITFIDNEEIERQLPAKYEVCPRCEGVGAHTNPAIDGNGITADEMAELGDEFFNDYMSGVYDIKCEQCDGLRVVLVPDEIRADAKLLKEYESIQDDMAYYDMQRQHEQQMGY